MKQADTRNINVITHAVNVSYNASNASDMRLLVRWKRDDEEDDDDLIGLSMGQDILVAEGFFRDGK